MLQNIINKLNNLRPKQLLALAGSAFALMLLTLYSAYNYLSTKNVVAEIAEIQQSVNEVETVSVVVAKVNIPPRTRIQETMLQVKNLPVEAVPEGAINSINDVKDVQVKVSIFAGDVLTVQKVFNAKDDEGFVGTIPPECRAVSISVNDLTSVAGFAKPGDRVDLLLVEQGQHSATANILLQNVPLLSINQDMTGSTPVGENGVQAAAISNPSIATLALPLEDVLKLISASKLGEIYMTLRPNNPRRAYVDAMEYTIESINAPQPEPVQEPVREVPVIQSAAPLPQIPSAPVAPVAPPAPKIEIIQGDQIIQSTDSSSAVKTASTAQSQALPVIPSGSPAAPQVPSLPIVTP